MLQIALGILAAIGGFVDIGDLVFNVQSGGLFGYQLIWAMIVGLIGIIVYAEMSGRVAAVSGRAVFDVIRERTGFLTGLICLCATEIVCVMTLAAECGGVALALRLLTGLPYQLLIPPSILAIGLIIALLPFDWIERVFGYIGLALLVFAVAAVVERPDWVGLAGGFVPSLNTEKPLLYLYFAVGLIGTTMSPYEVHFYSSGGIEDEWSPQDLNLNRVTAFLGFGLGALLSLSLIVVSTELFHPVGIKPEFLGTSTLAALTPLGIIGFGLALLGTLFAVGGAAVETAMAGAYSLAQFLGWQWGKFKGAHEAPRFTIAWVVFLAVAFLIIITGVDPVQVTEYAVIFAAVALPLTYLPILLVANDKTYMGRYRNGPLANVFGWAYLVIVTTVALAAIPLLVITGAGNQG